MNVLLLLAHSIEEYDQVRLLSSLGYSVFSIGAYTNPAQPADDKRPALPEVPYYPDLAALVEGDQMAHKQHLPDELIDWAEVIIVHHFPEIWIAANWPRIRGKRVIWRTVGQSNPHLELFMADFVRDGLEVVRYSPAERRAFEALGAFAGESALIRFWKDPDEWYGWDGAERVVLNVTQNLLERGEFTHHDFWAIGTQDLPCLPVGPGSDLIGGPGTVPFEKMQALLRSARCYLYTGTQPASYTLGLLEAMMTGCPVVSIGPRAMWLPALFEGHELANRWSDDPSVARYHCDRYLNDEGAAREASIEIRARAIAGFGRETIARQWQAYLA